MAAFALIRSLCAHSGMFLHPRCIGVYNANRNERKIYDAAQSDIHALQLHRGHEKYRAPADLRAKHSRIIFPHRGIRTKCINLGAIERFIRGGKRSPFRGRKYYQSRKGWKYGESRNFGVYVCRGAKTEMWRALIERPARKYFPWPKMELPA